MSAVPIGPQPMPEIGGNPLELGAYTPAATPHRELTPPMSVEPSDRPQIPQEKSVFDEKKAQEGEEDPKDDLMVDSKDEEEGEATEDASKPPDPPPPTSSTELKTKKKKKEREEDEEVKPLRGEQKKKFLEWIGKHADNLYPSRDEKLGLAKQLNASYIQVTRLLANHRRRLQVQKKRRSPDEAANSSDKENQRGSRGSEPPDKDDRLGHLNSVIDECSRLPPIPDEQQQREGDVGVGNGREDHEASNQFHCDELLEEGDEQKDDPKEHARVLRIEEAIEAIRERVRLLPPDFDIDEVYTAGGGLEMEGNYVTPPPSVHSPALSGDNSNNGNPNVPTPLSALTPTASAIAQTAAKSVDPPTSSLPMDSNQQSTATYQQHLLNLTSLIQQQQQQQQHQQLSTQASADQTQQLSAHLFPLLNSMQSVFKMETEGDSGVGQTRQPTTAFVDSRPQLALNQLIGNKSTVAGPSEIPLAASLQTTADSPQSVVVSSSANGLIPSISSASTASSSSSSMLFPHAALQAAFNNLQGMPMQSPQWIAALQLLQQQQAAAVAAQQAQSSNTAAAANEQTMAEMHQALARRVQQQMGGTAFTSALAELQNRQQQQQLQSAVAVVGATKTATGASTSVTPLTPDHVGDGDFGRSMEQKFAPPTAETLNLLNDNRHPNWMSPPLSSHTPASSASPMLFAADDNSEGSASRLPSAGVPPNATMLTVDNDPAFSDISSTCSGSPPPADFAPSAAPLPTITTTAEAALMNGVLNADSSVFTTPPTPIDGGKSTEKPKKRRMSKKAAAAALESIETSGIDGGKVNESDTPTTPVSSRKRSSVGGGMKAPRESAAAKRARLVAANPEEAKRLKTKSTKSKAKKALVIPSTLIVTRKFHELSENESIAVRVLAGLANGVYNH